MNRLIPLVAAALAASIAPAAHAAERVFAVSSFDRLAARGSPTVIVRTGRVPYVVATGDAQDVARLEIEVVDGELRTGMKRTAGWSWKVSRTPLTITVTTPGLRAVTLAGSGDVDVDRVGGATLVATLAGSGDLRLRAVDSADVSATLAGSGDLTAAGRCRSANFTLSGSGDLRAGALRCESVQANLVGSGGMDAYASRSADVTLIGSGDVTVAGGGTCRQTKRGSGSIRCG